MLRSGARQKQIFPTRRLRVSLFRRRPVGKICFCRGAKWCLMSAGMNQTHPLTTTTFELPGYRVAKCFGVVRGRSKFFPPGGFGFLYSEGARWEKFASAAAQSGV